MFMLACVALASGTQKDRRRWRNVGNASDGHLFQDSSHIRRGLFVQFLSVVGWLGVALALPRELFRPTFATVVIS